MMRTWLALARSMCVLALLSACGGPDGGGGGSDDAGQARGVLELGEGELSFRAIADGDTLLIARGCQGSQHVWLTLWSREMDHRGMIIDLELRRASDGALVSAMFHLRLSFEPDTSGELAQLSGITLQVPEPDTAIGEDLILWGRIQDRDGVIAESERSVRIAWGTETCSSPTG